jgi:hypothetical protein
MTSAFGGRWSRLLAFAVAVAVTGMLVISSGQTVGAQSEESTKGLQGTWRVQGTLLNCTMGLPLGAPPFPALISFARGGTATAVVSNPSFQPGQRTPSLGAWHATGPQSFSLVHEAFILFDGGIFHTGKQRITENIQVNGDQYTRASSSQFYDASGSPIGNPGCAMSVAQRMEE